MPLDRVEMAQLKAAIWKAGGVNLAGQGYMIGKKHVLELLELYSEETIEEIKNGKRDYAYVEGDGDGDGDGGE